MRTVLVFHGPNLNRLAVMGRCPDPAGTLAATWDKSPLRRYQRRECYQLASRTAALDRQGGNRNWFCQQRSAGNGA
jgi:hypothetical protein